MFPWESERTKIFTAMLPLSPVRHNGPPEPAAGRAFYFRLDGTQYSTYLWAFQFSGSRIKRMLKIGLIFLKLLPFLKKN